MCGVLALCPSTVREYGRLVIELFEMFDDQQHPVRRASS
jgi:hypothetical protein